MAGENTVDTLNGFFKEIYSDSLENLIPEDVQLSKDIDFSMPAERLGLQYNQPVTLTAEHGVTYGGTEGEAFTYNAPINGITKNAQVKGAEMVLRGQVSLGAISRSGDDAKSFGRATKHVMKNLINSAYKKHEIQCFYGGKGLCILDGAPVGNVFTILDEEFAPAIWVGSEGMKLSFYSSAGALRGSASVVAVDLDAKTVEVDTMPAGVVDTDVVYEFGAKDKEFIGIHKMLTEASTIFGISNTYSLWKGNEYDVQNAPLSYAKISKAIAAAVAKGVSGKLTLYVNPKSWSDLLTEQTAQRTFHEGGMSEYSNGAESIMFYSQNGKIEIKSSTFVKEGFAYALDLDCFQRVGSRDISFEVPGKKGQYVEFLESSNAIQLLAYCDTALFCEALGRNIVFKNIVPSS